MTNETTTAEKKYSIIYVDAPWEAKNWFVERVRDLPVEKRTASDALLLIWAPARLVPYVLLVLKKWGFEYAGLLAWQKPIDDGYWHRGHCEYMLIGKRGTARDYPLFRHTLYEQPSSDGDYKPEAFRALLLQTGRIAFGETAPHLDLFGGYWQRFFPEYAKEEWDFWEE